MSNDAAVVCQASVITLHILRWAQAVQSIWTKDPPYGTCGAHTRYVIWQAVSPPKMIEIANYHDIAKNRGDDDEGKGRSPGHVQVAPFAEKDQTNYIHQLID